MGFNSVFKGLKICASKYVGGRDKVNSVHV